MSIPVVESTAITYIGDGLTTRFEFPYDFASFDHIKLVLTASDGTTSNILSNYTYEPGTKKIVYPVSGTPLQANQKLTLSRETPITQQAVLPATYPFENIGDALDYITMIMQEQKWFGEHVLRFSPSSNRRNIIIPDGSAKELIGWDENGEKLINYSSADFERSVEVTTEAMEKAEAALVQIVVHEENATDAAEQSKLSELATKQYRDDTAQAITQAGALVADAYEEDVIYNYPTVVAYTDGYSYRCIGTNVSGENPDTSTHWVRSAMVANDFFDIDQVGDLMPAVSPVYSADFELDGNGDVMPKEV